MLKKDFIVFYQVFRDRLFLRYAKFYHDMHYGVLAPAGFNEVTTMLTLDLFDKIARANRRVSPAADIMLPAFITQDQFNTIISDIKTIFNG